MQHVTMKIFSISTYLFHTFPFIFKRIFKYSPIMEIALIFTLCRYLCVGAGITTLMSISDGSDRTLFCRKMERTRSVREEMDGRVFISRQSRHLFFDI